MRRVSRRRGAAKGRRDRGHGSRRVHVLDPQRVDGAIEDDPLVVVRVRREADRHADHTRGDAIRPLLRESIELACNAER